MRADFQGTVQKQMDMVFGIVDQSERGDGTGAQSEVTFHALFGGKGEFSLM